MTTCSFRSATALFLLSSTPLLTARLETPESPPDTVVPAPEDPLSARPIGEHDVIAGPFRLILDAGPPNADRGDWSDALQPALFRIRVAPAPAATRVTTAPR